MKFRSLKFRINRLTVVLAVGAVLLLPIAPPAYGAKNVRKLTLHDLDGNKTRWSDYKGRVVVLNFWATWCGPCKDEMPRLQQMAHQYANQNVAFVLLTIDEAKKLPLVQSFVAEQKISLPIWVGASTDLLQELSGTYVVPATLIVDANGEIVRTINGEAHEEDLKEAVDWLLSGQKGPIPVERIKRY